MQGNQENQRSAWPLTWQLAQHLTQHSAKHLATASSGLLLSWIMLPTPALAQEAPQNTPPNAVQVQRAEAPAVSPEVAPPPVAPVDPAEDPEETLTTLVTLMLGLLVLILGAGIIMLWFLRRSVVNEVATIVRTQLNEMTELENKVHNATRSLNRVLAEADDLSGELQGRSSNFQREIVTQREVLHKLIDELSEFKVQTARNWELQLEDING